MKKLIDVRCLQRGGASPTFFLEQLVNQLELYSLSLKFKATAWKWLGQSLLVLLTTAILVACGGSTIADSTDSDAGIPTPANRDPVVANDSAVVNQGSTVTINVLANDSDPDGDTLSLDTVEVLSQPVNGTATAQTDGSIVYENTEFGLTESFTYKVNDSRGAVSNVGTVTVTINRPPEVVVDSAVANQGTEVIIDVLANDSDPDDGDTLQPETVEVISNPINGTAMEKSNGTIAYQPSSFFAGPRDSFTYRVQDDKGATSNTATVTITINPSGVCFSTPQESPLTGTYNRSEEEVEVKLAASDPDNTPGGLTFSLNTDGSGGVGPITTDKGEVEITDPTTGAFRYTPTNSPPSVRGTDTFDYRVEDTADGAASGTVTVIIDPKIMPLGDSITEGTGTSGATPDPPVNARVGYRKKLYDDLDDARFFVDFVGGENNGGAAGIADDDHEGHPGINAFELADGGQPGNPGYTGIINALEANPADIVLLHIGTNDLGSTDDTDVGLVLSRIQAWEDSANGNPVTVILARIIDQDPFGGTVTSFNDADGCQFSPGANQCQSQQTISSSLTKKMSWIIRLDKSRVTWRTTCTLIQVVM